MEQSQTIVETFKQYRRRIYWIFADRGMMPKGTLDKTYPSISPNSLILNEAFIAENEDNDGSETEEEEVEALGMENVLAALPSPDLGFDECISHAPNIDDKIKPCLIDFVDDPLEMEIQDYMKALDMTNEERLLSLEYMQDEIDQMFYPDPADITFDNSEVFNEFDLSFTSSCLNFLDQD